MRLLKYRPSKRAQSALHNRQEIIRAGLSRRDLLKLGILTGAGCLIDGFSARGASAASPPTRAFVDLLPTARDGTMPVQTSLTLNPAPTAAPNTAAGEGRTITHQAFNQFPAQRFYGVTQKAEQITVSPDLPAATIDR